MKIIDIDKAHEHDYLVCLEDWNDTLKQAKHVKEQWFNEMKAKGLRAKLALTDDGAVGGMIEYMPIEYSYAEGKDLYIVNCIWVHGYPEKGVGNVQGKGMGVALLEAAEQDVKSLGMKGLAAWGISEEFWMTASWYIKHGYQKVDQNKWLILVWKPFAPDAVPPKWIKGSFTQELIPGKVKITSFHSGQCCSENMVYVTAKSVAQEFGDKVVFEEIRMNNPENIKKYGLNTGLYVNGENLFAGPPPSREQIKQKIEEYLKSL